MAQEASEEVPADRADQIFSHAKTWLVSHYGRRSGFSLRENLCWPKDELLQRQLNLYVGHRAGLEIHFQQAEGEPIGKLTIRERGRLEHHMQVYAGLLGLGVACITFLAMIWAGFREDWFIQSSRLVTTPHFHGGAFLLGTILPSLLSGLIAFAVAWPISLLCRPLCHSANRVERLVESRILLTLLVRENSPPIEDQH